MIIHIINLCKTAFCSFINRQYNFIPFALIYSNLYIIIFYSRAVQFYCCPVKFKRYGRCIAVLIRPIRLIWCKCNTAVAVKSYILLKYNLFLRCIYWICEHMWFTRCRAINSKEFIIILFHNNCITAIRTWHTPASDHNIVASVGVF